MHHEDGQDNQMPAVSHRLIAEAIVLFCAFAARLAHDPHAEVPEYGGGGRGERPWPTRRGVGEYVRVASRSRR